jgi:hypothetical protein
MVPAFLDQSVELGKQLRIVCVQILILRHGRWSFTVSRDRVPAVRDFQFGDAVQQPFSVLGRAQQVQGLLDRRRLLAETSIAPLPRCRVIATSVRSATTLVIIAFRSSLASIQNIAHTPGR